MTWILDAPAGWSHEGWMLVGTELVPRPDGERGMHPEWTDTMTLYELGERFGRHDPEARARTYEWHRSKRDAPDLSVASLVSTALGIRVPLSEVPRVFGHELTREGLAGLGFAVPVLSPPPPQITPHLVDAPAAAEIMSIKLQAFQQRVQRGQIPRNAIVRTGRRVQFIPSKLPGAPTK